MGGCELDRHWNAVVVDPDWYRARRQAGKVLRHGVAHDQVAKRNTLASLHHDVRG